MPKAGDVISSDDVEQILELIAVHQSKFPNTPLDVSFKYIMRNIGKHHAPVNCLEGEWEGTVADLIPLLTPGEDPKCPNGHEVERGNELVLVWMEKAPKEEEEESTTDESP